MVEFIIVNYTSPTPMKQSMYVHVYTLDRTFLFELYHPLGHYSLLVNPFIGMQGQSCSFNTFNIFC